MEPLKEFICDNCGEVIHSPEEGYVVWKHNAESKVIDIKILHKNFHLENGEKIGCDNDDSYTESSSLDRFLGPDGLVHAMSLEHPGPLFVDDDYSGISNKMVYMEFIRRTQIPYYEEARRYWKTAESDGFFDGCNDLWAYSQDTLQELIKKYKTK